MRYTGTVTRWYEDRGYGFISRSDGGGQVFLHVHQCGDGTVQEGCEVEFGLRDPDPWRGPGAAPVATEVVVTRVPDPGTSAAQRDGDLEEQVSERARTAPPEDAVAVRALLRDDPFLIVETYLREALRLVRAERARRRDP